MTLANLVSWSTWTQAVDDVSLCVKQVLSSNGTALVVKVVLDFYNHFRKRVTVEVVPSQGHKVKVGIRLHHLSDLLCTGNEHDVKLAEPRCWWLVWARRGNGPGRSTAWTIKSPEQIYGRPGHTALASWSMIWPSKPLNLEGSGKGHCNYRAGCAIWELLRGGPWEKGDQIQTLKWTAKGSVGHSLNKDPGGQGIWSTMPGLPK